MHCQQFYIQHAYVNNTCIFLLHISLLDFKCGKGYDFEDELDCQLLRCLRMTK